MQKLEFGLTIENCGIRTFDSKYTLTCTTLFRQSRDNSWIRSAVVKDGVAGQELKEMRWQAN